MASGKIFGDVVTKMGADGKIFWRVGPQKIGIVKQLFLFSWSKVAIYFGGGMQEFLRMRWQKIANFCNIFFKNIYMSHFSYACKTE